LSAVVARNLAKHFSPDIKAVDGIDLDIPNGQVFGFLGQNGSGKTTTVRMLTTLLKPTSGEAFVDGINVVENPAEVRRRVGVALQEVGLDDLQTGRELLTLQARLFGLRSDVARRRVAELLDVVTLADAADRPIKGYSGGMKRRLDLACALIHEPKIIFLDEPTTGLDPITRDAVWRYVQELNAGGVTFFLTTQYLEEADRLCHDIAIMDSGRIVARGAPADLKATIASDTIAVSFSDGPATFAVAEPIFRSFEDLEDLRLIDDQAMLYIHNGPTVVPRLVRAMDEAGITLSSLRLTHATLDDVFLRATGHALEVGASSSPAGNA